MKANNRWAPAKTTPVFDSYWEFAAERQRMLLRRLGGELPPWTADGILATYRFTNVYRAADRVSQYLIRNVIYAGDQSRQEVFFRLILFKIFNKISTWETIVDAMGIPSYAGFDFETYDNLLSDLMQRGVSIYSAAYIMPSGKSYFGSQRKHQNHLLLIQMMMKEKLALKISESRRMSEVFELLKSYPTIGDFLAYQFAIDINYSELTDFSENEFVVAGPGARDGISKCFSDLGGLAEADIIRLMTERQQEEFASRNLEMDSLWGRDLHLIDIQNVFCEISKYARVRHPEYVGNAGRSKIKQQFQPIGRLPTFWFPPKWGINQRVRDWYGSIDPPLGQSGFWSEESAYGLG
jgi:hypothetical protein